MAPHPCSRRGAIAGKETGEERRRAEILDKYQAVRPGAEDLAWFALDWAATLKDARERAAREQRPILFLHTNGRGNLFCGFC
jgi:hypothetical protein